MILEALISIIAALVIAIGDMFPEVETPAFLTTLGDQVDVVTGWMAPLGVWVPFGPAGNAVQVVLGAAAVAVTVKLIRVLLSLFTGGGGSAA